MKSNFEGLNLNFLLKDMDRDTVELGITENLEGLALGEELLLEWEKGLISSEGINEIFRVFHSLKGFAGFIGYEPLIKLSHEVESVLDRLRNDKFKVENKHVNIFLSSIDQCRELLYFLSTGSGKPDEGKLKTLALSLKNFGRKSSSVKQSTKTSKRKKTQGNSFLEKDSIDPIESVGLQDIVKDKQDEFSFPEGVDFRNKLDSTSSESVIRVSAKRVDQLVDLIGELVIFQSLLSGAADLDRLGHEGSDVGKYMTNITKISREVHDLAMSLRMVPLRSTFTKLKRIVRDTARQSSKLVSLNLEGENTEIDRQLIETITDPLVHMIRNSVDHGIEVPKERKQLGKSETGNITVRAGHESGYVVIEIVDDGRGIDVAAVKKLAVSKKISSTSEIENMSEADLLNLVFTPGFSTRDEVTEISGRGVGMDIVKTQVEKLNGSIVLQSRTGQGTSMKIRIPLTLAIIDGMLIRVGSVRYTIPLLSIMESIVPMKDQITRSAGGGEFVRIRETIFPVLRLHEIHGIPHDFNRLEDGVLMLLDNHGNDFALFVDELIGQQQTVVKALSRFMGKVSGVTACSILADGEISLILDVTSIYDSLDASMKIVPQEGKAKVFENALAKEEMKIE